MSACMTLVRPTFTQVQVCALYTVQRVAYSEYEGKPK